MLKMYSCCIFGVFLLSLHAVTGLAAFQTSKERMALPTSVPSGEESGRPLEETCSRRRMVQNSMLSLLGTVTASTYSPGNAFAEDEIDKNSATQQILSPKMKAPKKPFAPTSALLPAARVKFTFDESINLIEEHLSQEESMRSNEKRDSIIKSLEAMIFVKSYMNPLSDSGSPASKAQPIDENMMKPAKAKLYQETYKDKLKDISPVDVPYALLTKAGDYRQFDQLQKRQRKLEKVNSIREALNYYTRQLQFDTESYVLNASAEDKKKMIRNDALPDIKSVIVSDLDMRDLQRNQVLDAYDDVKFELQYQIKNCYENGSDFDWYELKTVLGRAKAECDQWFSFIDTNDVDRAIEIVRME